MSLFFKALFLEAVSSVLYDFGNRLMDLTFLIPFVIVSVSTSDVASVIRPALLYQVLSYTVLLRETWLFYMQWLISRGLACKVSMARMEVRYPQ
ncbi:hypothetical protein PoB_002461500 [Plakobranchus ocellatus]|uniref:ABC transmembrane type-1 domain-containing protein n=1 Tax=Plakobranchus ocellatus TaxID=259542 RepID=A0AAV3ZTZ7_9GAST|nr:hypothetical protein PoB_002461500 [Plakobranchus ocellatus]